jgi:drug/metabolite transporter (DMT)-like permease
MTGPVPGGIMEDMTGLIVAAALATLSSAAYAGAAVAQQRVGDHERTGPAVPSRNPARRAGRYLYFLLAQRGWWLAVGLNAAGAALHVVALRFGPLTLVQPLGALTLVLAVPLAAITASRRVGRREWRGAAVTVLGLAGIFALTSTNGTGDGAALGAKGILILAGLTAAVLLVLAMAARSAGGTARGLIYATAAGGTFAVASVLTKTVVLLVDDPLERFTPLVLASIATGAMAIGGLLLSQSAYQHTDVAAPTAAITLVNPLVAAAIGLTLLGERLAAGTPGAVLALGFAAVAAVGVIQLVTAGQEHRDHPVEHLASSRAR